MSTLNFKIIGQGKPLIFLHGWCSDSRIFYPLISKLIENYQLFLIDLPGFGKSPELVNHYHCEKILPLLLEIIPLEANWIGWSMGGLIAFWAAIYFPDYVSRLITVASSPKFMSDSHWPGIQSAVLQKFSHHLSIFPTKTLNDFLELQLRGSSNKDSLHFEIQKKLLFREAIPLQSLQGGLNLLMETDLRKDLNKITCPNLHIFGQNDTIVPIKTMDALQSLLPQGKYEVIRRSSHMPFLSHPDQFITLLNRFLS